MLSSGSSPHVLTQNCGEKSGVLFVFHEASFRKVGNIDGKN